MIDELLRNPIFQIILHIVAVLSFILGFVFFILSRKSKKPMWAIESNNLVRGFSKRLPELDIRYSGESVENLTISKIVFWNGGRDTIHGSDIAERDRLRIVPVGQIRILDVKLLKANQASSGCLLATELDMTAAYLTFDFLDKGSGARIQIVHTGVNSNAIEVCGTIKGAGSPKKRNSSFLSPRAMIRDIKPIIVSIMLVLGVGGLSILRSGFFNALPLLALGLFFACFFGFIIFGLARIPNTLTDEENS